MAIARKRPAPVPEEGSARPNARLGREPIPSAKRTAFHHARTSPGVGTHVPEPAAQDADQLQIERRDELADCGLRVVDHVAAGFGMLTVGEPFMDRQHSSADAVTRVDDRHVRAHRRQFVRGGESSQAGTRDQDGGPGQIS